MTYHTGKRTNSSMAISSLSGVLCFCGTSRGATVCDASIEGCGEVPDARCVCGTAMAGGGVLGGASGGMHEAGHVCCTAMSGGDTLWGASGDMPKAGECCSTATVDGATL